MFTLTRYLAFIKPGVHVKAFVAEPGQRSLPAIAEGDVLCPVQKEMKLKPSTKAATVTVHAAASHWRSVCEGCGPDSCGVGTAPESQDAD